MDCVESQDLLQRWLDGEPAALDRADWTAHLSGCSECREWYAATRCLRDGLALLSPPQPPADLGDRICRHILTERIRTTRTRRMLFASAIAAGLLLAWCSAYFGLRTASSTNPSAELARLEPERPVLSLHDQIEEASSAVVALTRRTADETMRETRLLLPVDIPQASVAGPPQLGHALEPSAQSLREIQQSMAAGLEPVATSARRAVGLFLSNRQWAVTRQ
ncbi:MAG TPA: zf-HC2 domain-containing protein [Gemmataceae bacterium]|nr:zf-HC2 domain-containing protein [Gemmataceae bacterium]